MSDAVVRLTFPAKADYLLLARLALSGVARNLSIEEELLADLKLAVTEACGNSVRHAYGPEGGTVSVTYELSDGRLEVVVEDTGKGIALRPLAADAHVEPGEAALEGGMGMPIIRAIVDELEVTGGAEGRGTVVRMAKLLESPL
jgi:serine/threonine-protein kinase RsbW